MDIIAHFVAKEKSFQDNILFSQHTAQLLHHPAVKGRPGAPHFAGIREEDLHDPVAGEHVDDGTHLPVSGIIFSGEPTCTIFSDLGEGSVVRNVNFENVTYELLEVPENVLKIKISALAKSAKGTTVSNVTVTGKLVTDYTGELPTLLQPFYEEDSTGDVSSFTAVITVVFSEISCPSVKSQRQKKPSRFPMRASIRRGGG